jgi:hypothetical protein
MNISLLIPGQNLINEPSQFPCRCPAMGMIFAVKQRLALSLSKRKSKENFEQSLCLGHIRPVLVVMKGLYNQKYFDEEWVYSGCKTDPIFQEENRYEMRSLVKV